MLIIASNLTTRNRKVSDIFKQAKAAGWSADKPSASALGDLARQCFDAGAEVLEINIQQHYDLPEAMEFAVRAVQQVTDRQLCLSTGNPQALDTGLRTCKRPPIVNYISVDETRLNEMFPAAVGHNAEVVLLVSEPTRPADAREMIQKAAILVGAANAAGISNERIFIDPGIIHVTAEAGQRHLVEIKDFLQELPEFFEPPVRSTCWLHNISTGTPRRLQPFIETNLLAMLGGLGLSSVFLDVLSRENMRTVKLIKMLNDELIYANAALE